MRDESPHAAMGRLTGVLAGAALALSAQQEAAAEPPGSPLASGLLDLPAPQREAAARRFATPDGAVRFVLDRSGGRVALVRFEGEDEVHVLRPVAGPRGDEIYKTDTGALMLRVTALGGVIVFRDAAGRGAPAEFAGEAEPLRPPPPPANLAQEFALLERRVSVEFGRPVAFAPPPSDPRAAGLVAEAAYQAAMGLARARARGAEVRRVVIVFGPRPTATLLPDGALRVVVTPELGYAGRPSAALVSQVVAGPER